MPSKNLSSHLQFLEELKSTEKFLTEKIERLQAKALEYDGLKRSVNNRGKSLVEIGPGFYAKGYMNNGPLYVDIGCGTYLEMNEDECIKFCDFIAKKLSLEEKHFDKELFGVKSKINLVLLALRESG